MIRNQKNSKLKPCGNEVSNPALSDHLACPVSVGSNFPVNTNPRMAISSVLVAVLGTFIVKSSIGLGSSNIAL